MRNISTATIGAAVIATVAAQISSTTSVSEAFNPGTTLSGDIIWHHGSTIGSIGTVTNTTVTSAVPVTQTSGGVSSTSTVHVSMTPGMPSSSGQSSGSPTASSPAATSKNVAPNSRNVPIGGAIALGLFAGML